MSETDFLKLAESKQSLKGVCLSDRAQKIKNESSFSVRYISEHFGSLMGLLFFLCGAVFSVVVIYWSILAVKGAVKYVFN